MRVDGGLLVDVKLTEMSNEERAKALGGQQPREMMAEAFSVPVIINSKVREGSLRQAVAEEGIPFVLYEAGEALRFDEGAIRAGIRGILSVMASTGMLKPGQTKKSVVNPLIAESTTWVRAPSSGILKMSLPLGSKVGINKKLGENKQPQHTYSPSGHSPSLFTETFAANSLHRFA